MTTGARAGGTGRATRRYSSARRRQLAAQTRAEVVAAAARLFAARGWAATGIRDVAAEAGVAVETVYANFGSKAELLKAAIDTAVVGDAEPVPLADRPEFAALAVGDRAARAAAAAGLVHAINARSHGLERALHEGAASDADLAERLAANDESRRVSVAAGGAAVAGRPLADAERDGLWALTGVEVYELLVLRSHWSADRYREWLADTILRLLGGQPGSE